MSWHNQLVLLTGGFQQLGSIVGGVLINAFKPFIQALNSVMGAIINFAQVVSDALGAIFGWEYQTGGGVSQDLEVGAGAAGEIEDATGGAADNAKKLNKYIAGWHEVNNMTSDSKDKGSGGAGMSDLEGLGDADGGKWLQKESLWEKYTSEIDSLYALGDYISGVLTDTMNSINWDDVYRGAMNFGTNLARFLNHLIKPELFSATGQTIAGALNTVIYAAFEFGSEFNWWNLGFSIAEGINEFFDTFDFATLANTIDVWAQGILESAITAIQKIQWDKIGEEIGKFIERIDFFETFSLIGELIWEGINAGIDFFKGMFDVAPIETIIVGALAGSMVVANVAKIISGAFLGIQGVLSALMGPLTAFGGLFVEGGIFSATGPIALASAPVLALGAALATLAGGLAYVFITNENVRSGFLQAVDAIKSGLSPTIQFVTNTLIPDLNNGWNALFDILEPLGKFIETVFTDVWTEILNPALEYIGTTIIPTLSETFSNLWNSVLKPFGEFLGSILSPVIENVSDVLIFLWKNVGIPVADFIGGILSESFESLSKIFNDLIIPKVNGVIEVFQFMWEEVFVPVANYLKSTFQPVFETVFSTIGEIIEALKTSLSGLIQFVTGVFTGDWELAWEGVKNVFKGIFNGVISLLESGVNFIIRGLNKMLSGLDGVVNSVGDVIGLDIGIPSIREVSLPRLYKGGILKKGQIGLLEGSGAEAVVPLEKNTQWISRVAENMSNELGKYKVNTHVPKPDFSPISYDLGKFKSTMQMEMDAKMAEYSYGIRQQNKLLQEQNELLRGIYNKPVLSDDDVFNATRRGQSKFQRRTFRTGWAGID